MGRVTAKYPELQDLCSKLTRIKDINSLFEHMTKEFNTIVALMYQGGEHGKATIKHWEYRQGSLLDAIASNLHNYLGNELNMINLSSFLFRHLLDTP